MEKKILLRGIFFFIQDIPIGTREYRYQVLQDEIRTHCSPLPEVIATSFIDTPYIIIYRQAICHRTET